MTFGGSRSKKMYIDVGLSSMERLLEAINRFVEFTY